MTNLLLLAAETGSPGRGGNTDEGSGTIVVVAIAAVVIAALAIGLWLTQRSKV
jgi:hypothetical protein